MAASKTKITANKNKSPVPILKKEDKIKILNSLSAEIQLFVCAVADVFKVYKKQWQEFRSGFLCFIYDAKFKSYFFRLYTLKPRPSPNIFKKKEVKLVWNFLIRPGLTYHKMEDYFGAFKQDDDSWGFRFLNDNEALTFGNMVIQQLDGPKTLDDTNSPSKEEEISVLSPVTTNSFRTSTLKIKNELPQDGLYEFCIKEGSRRAFESLQDLVDIISEPLENSPLIKVPDVIISPPNTILEKSRRSEIADTEYPFSSPEARMHSPIVLLENSRAVFLPKRSDLGSPEESVQSPATNTFMPEPAIRLESPKESVQSPAQDSFMTPPEIRLESPKESVQSPDDDSFMPPPAFSLESPKESVQSPAEDSLLPPPEFSLAKVSAEDSFMRPRPPPEISLEINPKDIENSLSDHLLPSTPIYLPEFESNETEDPLDDLLPSPPIDLPVLHDLGSPEVSATENCCPPSPPPLPPPMLLILHSPCKPDFPTSPPPMNLETAKGSQVEMDAQGADSLLDEILARRMVLKKTPVPNERTHRSSHDLLTVLQIRMEARYVSSESEDSNPNTSHDWED